MILALIAITLSALIIGLTEANDSLNSIRAEFRQEGK